MSVKISAKKILQQYHEVFYKLFQVPLDWINVDNQIFTLCSNEHCHPLCRKIMDYEEGRAACGKMTMDRVRQCMATRRLQIDQCHAGLIDTIVPLFVEDKYIGSLSIGQFLCRRPRRQEIESIAKQLSYLDISADELKRFYDATPVIPEEKVHAMLELVKMIGEYVCESESKLLFLRSINENNNILAARNYIESRYKSKLTIDEIAHKVGLSPSYFSHMFTKETGSSPIQYLNSYRIVKAIELLRQSNMSITEISYEVGFQSLPHFNRVFRKATGKSPRAFKTAKSKILP